VWIVIATIGNLAMRAAWPGYAEVEAAMKFTPEMMMFRLLVGALSSIGAGWLTARITNQNRGAIYALAALLIVTSFPCTMPCGKSFRFVPSYFRIARPYDCALPETQWSQGTVQDCRWLAWSVGSRSRSGHNGIVGCWSGSVP
jgi:hypothetical protein